MHDTRLIDFQMDFVNLQQNHPVTVRLEQNARFDIGSNGIELVPSGSHAPVSLAMLAIASDAVALTPGDTSDVVLTIGVRLPATAGSLAGNVSIGSGSVVTLGQVGSRDTDEVTMSRAFLVDVR